MSLGTGARLFDDGRFFEAHEAWEEHWLVETDETKRRLFQGLIQIAAACHKLFVMNARESAERLLAKGLAKLDACPDEAEGIDLAAFRDALRVCARDLAGDQLVRASIPRLTAARAAR